MNRWGVPNPARKLSRYDTKNSEVDSAWFNSRGTCLLGNQSGHLLLFHRPSFEYVYDAVAAQLKVDGNALRCIQCCQSIRIWSQDYNGWSQRGLWRVGFYLERYRFGDGHGLLHDALASTPLSGEDPTYCHSFGHKDNEYHCDTSSLVDIGWNWEKDGKGAVQRSQIFAQTAPGFHGYASDKCLLVIQQEETRPKTAKFHHCLRATWGEVVLNVVLFLVARQLMYSQPWYEPLNPAMDIHVPPYMWMLPCRSHATEVNQHVL